MLWIVSSQLTRKRAREEEIEAAEKAKREREWQKNFEASSSVTAVTTLYKWKHGDAVSVSKWLFFFFLGNKRWACGQLEDLPGQRQENQGEKEQVLPQTPESQDGTERMTLQNWTLLKLTIVKTPVLCILTSSSSQPCVLHHRDTSSSWPM